jgi:hypothetical protein
MNSVGIAKGHEIYIYKRSLSLAVYIRFRCSPQLVYIELDYLINAGIRRQ